MGVDPAKNIATIANKKGIKTIPSFFNSNVVKKILSKAAVYAKDTKEKSKKKYRGRMKAFK